MSKNQIESSVSQNQYRNLLVKDTRTKQLTSSDINRILNLGLNMKIVLMQPEAIKVVQQMLKIVKKMNITTFLYMQHADNLLNNIKKKINKSLDDSEDLFQSPKKSTQKQINSENLQASRDKMVQTIVEQLYNARQESLKIEQIDQRFTFSNGYQISNQLESDEKQLTKFNQKDYEQSHNEIIQLKRSLAKYEQESKVHKRMIEETTKSCLQKDEKIQNLKNTISRLEQVVIKQFKVQGQPELRPTASQANSSQKSNQPNLIKSEALQREVVQLKQQIHTLRQNLAQSVALQPMQKKPSQKEKALQSMKMKDFLKISKEYAVIKQQLIDETKVDYHEIDSLNDSNNSELESSNTEVNLKVQFQILNEKYNNLNRLYNTLKQEHEKIARRAAVLKKQSVFSISSAHLSPASTQSPNPKPKPHQKSSSKQPSSTPKLDINSDDQQIIRDINQINKMQKLNINLSNTMGVSSFESIINAKQMTNKIQGFQYNNSFIHKVNSTKFIPNFQAKLALVLQYVCILELYFSRAFLSCVREELMMEDSITIKQIASGDLNPAYYVQSTNSQQNNSFNINSSKISSVSSPNKASSRNQFSINDGLSNNMNQDLADSVASMPVTSAYNSNRQITRKKIEVLQKQLFEVSSLITDQYLNPHQLRDDRQFILRVQKLKQNRIAVMITNIIKQNDVFKKCINQMIKSEQNITKQNNEIYFDEQGQVRRRSNSNVNSNTKKIETENGGQKMDKDKENCCIM